MSCSGKSFDFVNQSCIGFFPHGHLSLKKKEEMFVSIGVAPLWALKKG